jgi:hypothetical protein
MAGLFFSKGCPSEPIEKANLDKSYFQPSLRDWSRHTVMAGLFSASAVQIGRSKKPNLDKAG